MGETLNEVHKTPSGYHQSVLKKGRPRLTHQLGKGYHEGVGIQFQVRRERRSEVKIEEHGLNTRGSGSFTGCRGKNETWSSVEEALSSKLGAERGWWC